MNKENILFRVVVRVVKLDNDRVYKLIFSVFKGNCFGRFEGTGGGCRIVGVGVVWYFWRGSYFI